MNDTVYNLCFLFTVLIKNADPHWHLFKILWVEANQIAWPTTGPTFIQLFIYIINTISLRVSAVYNTHDPSLYCIK